MLKLNRKTEYALLALQHIFHKEAAEGEVTSTREISEFYHIPNPVLAKVLQKLASKGLVKAIHGTKGGYILAKRPEAISVADVIQIFDGRVAVAECFKDEKITCPQWDGCMIKDPLSLLNQKIFGLVTRTTLADLVGPEGNDGPSGAKSPEGPELPIYYSS